MPDSPMTAHGAPPVVDRICSLIATTAAIQSAGSCSEAPGSGREVG